MDLPVEACAEATLAATEGREPVIIGPLRNATVGDECRAAFARDELSEDDDESAALYTGEARETAWKLMQEVNSKARAASSAFRTRASRMKAAGRPLTQIPPSESMPLC